jgi:hypothetical protein
LLTTSIAWWLYCWFGDFFSRILDRHWTEIKKRTKHCVSLDWQSYPDPWQSWNDLRKWISMSP